MRPMTRLTAVLLALLTLLPAVANADRGTSRQAKLLLDNAILELEKSGPEAAFASFNNPSGPFVQKDLYIFAIDMKGKYYASGANPALVGSSLAEVSDAAGTPVGQQILKLAEVMGYGIVEYEWLNRQSNDVEHKFSRIRRVGDYVLGVGFYLPETD
ncbi:cache domain-containing protein [Motiliproteus sediminis]|uniref:cache domain-containing protein n=1 Tax=Motiliproteus sediminis TaxID=1468178 RepID=UPI001AEFEF21|nr:cache domain-containing protein [Motiliproteus sediminis]